MPEPPPIDETSTFSSPREKRLWLASLATIGAIFTTLLSSSILADAWYNQNLSAIAFLFCMALVGLTVMTQGLNVKAKGVELGVGLGIAAVYFMVFFRLTIPERSHLIEYSVLTVFIYEALVERKSHGRKMPIPAILAVLAASLVGAIDEFIQLFLPTRVFDWTDILFNFLASITAAVSVSTLRFIRRFFSTQ